MNVKKKKENIQELWKIFNRIEEPEREQRENKVKELFEVIMAEDVPKLMIDTKPQIYDAQRMKSRKNTKKI